MKEWERLDSIVNPKRREIFEMPTMKRRTSGVGPGRDVYFCKV